MCLENISEKRVAEEDIVCYKYLKVESQPKLNFVPKSGASFEGRIYGIDCTGKITRENGKIYFCTNENNIDGEDCEKKWGYKYSWKLDEYVTLITINGKILIDREENQFVTPYRDVIVKMGKTYISRVKVSSWNEIGQALHSYVDIPTDNVYPYIAKCIIPKGATYYEGIFDERRSYASNKLKYINIIEQ